MIYKFSEGTRLPGIDPQAAGERLEAIRKRHNGHLLPKYVVDDARKPSSPLHDAFTWDDTEAADQYRLVQARYLIRHIVVVISEKNEPERTIRALVSIRGEDDNGSTSYVAIDDAMRSKNLRAQVLQKAYDELIAWAERYRRLQEFAAVIEVIDALPAPPKGEQKKESVV
jgi:hypothetical protein